MKKNYIVFIFIVTFILSMLYAIAAFKQEVLKTPLPALGQVQSFELVDQNGNPFSSNQLRGKVWVANFFFTTCSDICPLMNKNMASLSRTFEQIPAVSLISITVNPETDNSSVLKKYEERFKGKKDNWYFLTGKREDITKIALESF